MPYESPRQDDQPTLAVVPAGLQTKYMSAVLAAIAVAALYFGQPILMPVALAMLLAFALGPVVTFLRGRLHFPRVIAVIATVTITVVIISGLATFIGTQVTQLAVDLPHYQSNLARKVRSIRGTASDNDVVERASAMLSRLGDQIVPSAPPGPRSLSRARGANQPIAVEVHQPEPTPLETVQNVVASLIEPLAMAGIVLVFVIFILLQKDDLRDRFIRLVGARDLQRTTAAIDDGAVRLSRYLLAQTAINATFGVIIAGGLWFIGIPNAGLWGLLGMLLRFVPYVGVPIAAIFPVALALAVDPGWSAALWTLALFFITEPILGQVVEPWVYGRSMGLSPVAVLVAATFWTWLWGPIGLLLSTPLTMCLVVLGRHVETLKFLDVLLGNRPALAAEESFYLRLLAGDPDGAASQADAYLKDHSLVACYDGLAVRALALAQDDANRGALDEERQHIVKATVAGVIENLSDRDESGAVPPPAERKANGAAPPQEPRRPEPVVIVAARGPLDEAAGLLLADILCRRGISARVVPREGASAARVHELEPEGVKVFCISHLEPAAYNDARYLLRRLAKRLPAAREVLGFWCSADEDTRYLDAIEATKSDDVVTNLAQAASRIGTLLAPAPSLAAATNEAKTAASAVAG